MTKAQKHERADAITKLKEWLQPGDTVYTILRHVSRSGMQREISCVILEQDELQEDQQYRHPIEPRTLDYWVSRALGERIGTHGGIVVGGCGMDMGFHLVYELSATLYGHLRCTDCGKAQPQAHVDRIAQSPLAYSVGLAECTFCGRRVVGGYACLGKDTDGHRRCPSSYHTNAGHLDGGRAAERWDLIHTDGYALRQRWL